jgi:uncharacterized membrane protein (DUF485 family)
MRWNIRKGLSNSLRKRTAFQKRRRKKRRPLKQNLREKTQMRAIADFGFLLLFFFLLAVWALAWLAFHVAGGGIHLLLIVAVIALVMHLFRSRSAV